MNYQLGLLGVSSAFLLLAGQRNSVPAADRPEPPLPTRAPLVRVIDLNAGDSQVVELCNGTKVTVKLLDVQESRDDIRSAVRVARVKVAVNGKPITLNSGNYHLPQSVGAVRIDCPITKGYLTNSMANEPVYVDGGENPAVRKIYYHYGLDIGGAEALVQVVAATDGLVVSSGKSILDGYEKTPVQPRYDVVYLLDEQGWYYRYSHLHSIDAAIKPGVKVKKGQKLGLLGKEGGSGGWSHLHFDITSKQPSGKWGIQEGYAFLWEAYQNEHHPKIQAVARPHHLAWAGEQITLDGSCSWAADKIERFEWTFTDGQTAKSAMVTRSYDRPGSYSEILKVVDGQGRIDYDFAVVQILEREHPDRLPPSIHAAFAPTLGIKPGDAITFKVRSFRTAEGGESWDFGDGSPPVRVKSDGNAVKLARDGYAVTTHRYAKAGHYLVRVEHTSTNGTAVARLHVRVGDK